MCCQCQLTRESATRKKMHVAGFRDFLPRALSSCVNWLPNCPSCHHQGNQSLETSQNLGARLHPSSDVTPFVAHLSVAINLPKISPEVIAQACSYTHLLFKSIEMVI